MIAEICTYIVHDKLFSSYYILIGFCEGNHHTYTCGWMWRLNAVERGRQARACLLAWNVKGACFGGEREARRPWNALRVCPFTTIDRVRRGN